MSRFVCSSFSVFSSLIAVSYLASSISTSSTFFASAYPQSNGVTAQGDNGETNNPDISIISINGERHYMTVNGPFTTEPLSNEPINVRSAIISQSSQKIDCFLSLKPRYMSPDPAAEPNPEYPIVSQLFFSHQRGTIFPAGLDRPFSGASMLTCFPLSDQVEADIEAQAQMQSRSNSLMIVWMELISPETQEGYADLRFLNLRDRQSTDRWRGKTARVDFDDASMTLDRAAILIGPYATSECVALSETGLDLMNEDTGIATLDEVEGQFGAEIEVEEESTESIDSNENTLDMSDNYQQVFLRSRPLVEPVPEVKAIICFERFAYQ